MANRDEIMRLLEASSELPSDKRAAFLDEACRGDAAMRAELESLLVSLDAAGRFLSEPTIEVKSVDGGEAPNLLDRTLAGRAGEAEGQTIGRYKLLQLLGEGGFGTVWMAEQREPVKRRVALKIIKLGMDTRQVIARFEAERQALAMMDHPNIAKVFDAGSTETGRLYFVMEYIRGVPILEYCDTEKVDTRTRLALFAEVCQAIQHAHQKGVIHRDIKSTNVLVTMHDGVPVPKVIDFGIAKATNAELTQRTLFTEHRQMVGTPAYMSPEQAEMSGLDVDTRSDVYSLGVLLYELLTGTTPFASEELLSKGFAEMMRIIREVEPPRPSTRLSSMGAMATKSAQQRLVSDSRRLITLLEGDLDWIVMKCLEKDRTRRYDSASGLAADIRRFLSDEPVLAGAPSAVYRAQKFVKRNRGAVAAVGCVGVALLLGVAGTTAGMLRALNQSERANAEAIRATNAAEAEANARVVAEASAERARLEAARADAAQRDEAAARLKAEEARERATVAQRRAETISQFVTTSLKSADAYERSDVAGAGQDMTVLAAMDLALRDIDGGRFADDPATEVSLRATIAAILSNNGDTARAERVAEKALEMARQIYAPLSQEVAFSLELVGGIKAERGKLEEADQLVRAALLVQRQLPESEPSVLAGVLNTLAGIQRDAGRLLEARSLFEECLTITKQIRNGDHPEIAICLNNMALVEQYLGNYAEAQSLYAESLAMQKRLYTGDHPDIAATLSNLGFVYGETGRLGEAEPMFEQAFAMRERLFRGDNAGLARTLSNLAAIRQRLGRLQEASEDATRALSMARRLHGGDHPLTVTTLNCLGLIDQASGDLPRADSSLSESLAMARRLYSGDHPDLATALNNLAALRLEQRRLSEAEPLFAEAMSMRDRLYQDDHPLRLLAMRNLARVWREMGRTEEADVLDRRASEMMMRLQEHDDAGALSSRAMRAVELWSAGRLDESIPLFEQVLRDQERVLGRDHPQTRVTAANLGVNYKDAKRYAEALALLEAAQKAATDQPELRFTYPHLLETYALSDQAQNPQTRTKALALVDDIVADFRSEYPAGSVQLASGLSHTAIWLDRLKAWDQAEPLVREALAIREEQSPDAWTTFNSRSMLGGVLLSQGKLEEAEPLLVAGFEGLKQRETQVPVSGRERIPEAVDRLIRLATLKRNDSEVARWKAERDAIVLQKD